MRDNFAQKLLQTGNQLEFLTRWTFLGGTYVTWTEICVQTYEGQIINVQWKPAFFQLNGLILIRRDNISPKILLNTVFYAISRLSVTYVTWTEQNVTLIWHSWKLPFTVELPRYLLRWRMKIVHGSSQGGPNGPLWGVTGWGGGGGSSPLVIRTASHNDRYS